MKEKKHRPTFRDKASVVGCILSALVAIGFTIALYYEMLFKPNGDDLLVVFWFGSIAFSVEFCAFLMYKNERFAKLRSKMIVVAIVAFITIIIPIGLRVVYCATESNIIETQETRSGVTEVIYFGTSDEAKQFQVDGENAVIEVKQEENVKPYVEKVKYQEVLVRDNKNPWGFKSEDVIKEWTAYEFHLPKQ